jgi:hypothetical protein
MPVYTRDRSFSLGWTLGGTALMFITNLVGGVLAGVAGVRSTWALLALAIGCFGAGGFIVGWKSEGRTILEAGLAAALATALTYIYRVMVSGASLNALALLIGAGIPFCAGLLGGWIGEMVQGDTIEE